MGYSTFDAPKSRISTFHTYPGDKDSLPSFSHQRERVGNLCLTGYLVHALMKKICSFGGKIADILMAARLYEVCPFLTQPQGMVLEISSARDDQLGAKI